MSDNCLDTQEFSYVLAIIVLIVEACAVVQICSCVTYCCLTIYFKNNENELEEIDLQKKEQINITKKEIV